MKTDIRFEKLVLSGPQPDASARIPLRCGPIRLGFEAETGALRTIVLGEQEILQNIDIAVRDANWGTVAPKISDLLLQADDDAFHLTFDAVCLAHDLAFHWSAEISGDADGTLRYVMHGTAQTAFYANRIGFCVLHPLGNCVGCPCMVEHVDGSIEQAAFPETISPYQPFLQIRALTYRVRPGIHATVRFEGDTFEMEDHRNWTDSSFKTYCPPLSLPFPSAFSKGQTIRQSVTLSLEIAPRACSQFSFSTPAPNANNGQGSPIQFRIAAKSCARSLPRIGLAAASHDVPPSLQMSAKDKERSETGACRIRLLDAVTAEFAMREPERYRTEAWQSVTMPLSGLDRMLPPYAILRLDFEEVEDD